MNTMSRSKSTCLLRLLLLLAIIAIHVDHGESFVSRTTPIQRKKRPLSSPSMRMRIPWMNRCIRTDWRLSTADDFSSSSSSPSSLTARLKLYDRFDRWKFLQELLDDMVEDEDVHQLLYVVLSEYQASPKDDNRDADDVDDEDDDKEDEGKSNIRIATPQQRDIVTALLENANANTGIPAMTDTAILQQIEQLLPDPEEDEDGMKSCWDTVMELHGRESVKVNEEAGDPRWKAVSIVSRVLIHYEFLLDGIESLSRD